MEIEHCRFPDDLLYDVDNNTWVRIANSQATVGLTSLLSAIAGKFIAVKLKAPGHDVGRGNSLGTVESGRMVGPIPSPVSGTILATNDLVVKRPKIMNDTPYDDGWIARLSIQSFDTERNALKTVQQAQDALRQKIAQHRAKCFNAFPDHELVEIGVECAAVLIRLDELIHSIPVGDVVHVVSDEPTAYVEMIRWSDASRHLLADWRKDDGLFHFVVKKTHE